MDNVERSIQFFYKGDDYDPAKLDSRWYRTASELEMIWRQAVVDSPERKANDWLPTWADGFTSVVCRRLEKTARAGGVEAMLDAYYEGVPIEDILPYNDEEATVTTYYADGKPYFATCEVPSGAVVSVADLFPPVYSRLAELAC